MIAAFYQSSFYELCTRVGYEAIRVLSYPKQLPPWELQINQDAWRGDAYWILQGKVEHVMPTHLMLMDESLVSAFRAIVLAAQAALEKEVAT